MWDCIFKSKVENNQILLVCYYRRTITSTLKTLCEEYPNSVSENPKRYLISIPQTCTIPTFAF